MAKIETEKKQQYIFVIAGKDDCLVNLECEKLLDRLLPPEQRITSLFSPDPANVSVCEVLDELRTLPFLADKRVVLIKRAGVFISENRQLLERYFQNPCSTGILILTVANWDARTRLAKQLPTVGKLISLVQPNSSQLPYRLTQYARDAHDKKLAVDAAGLLIELTGDELGLLYSEIDKLALFATDEKTITAHHVESLIGHNRLFNAFAVIDAVTAGNTAQAIDRLRSMFAEDRTAEFMVVGAFAFHFRRMFNAKAFLEKGVSAGEVAHRLRIRYNKDAFFSQLHKITLQQIGTYLQQLARIDYAIKTGQTKPQVAIEQLVLKLATS